MNEHVTCMGKMGKLYKVLLENLKRRYLSEDILKPILAKQGLEVWIGFI
jgi:hypothetical protein